MDKKNKNDELKVEWLGIDGALVFLFIFLSALYGYGIINRVDFIIGIIAPGIAIAMTVGVFIKYCTEVFAFSTGKKNKK